MPAEQFFSLLTTIGAAQLTNAVATNTTVDITEIAVGSGELDAYYTPIETQTALKTEVWRGAINNKYVHATNPNWVVFEVAIPADTPAFMIREAAVFDTTGNMIFIAKMPESYKPALAQGSGKDMLVRFIGKTSNAAQVSLSVDPGVVLATHTYVDNATATLEAALKWGPARSLVITGATFEASVLNGQPVYRDAVNSYYAKALADGTGTNKAVGIADVTNGLVISEGETPAGLITGLTAGETYYLDGTTAGTLTAVAPNDSVKMGVAIAANVLFVDVDAAPPATVNPIVQRRIKYLGNTSNSGAIGNFTVTNWDDVITLTDAGNYLHAKVHCGQTYVPSTGNDHMSIGVSDDGANFKTTGTAGYEARGHEYRPGGQEGGSTIIGEMIWAPGTVGPHTIYALLYSNSGQQGSPTFSWSNCYIELIELDASLVTINAF